METYTIILPVLVILYIEDVDLNTAILAEAMQDGVILYIENVDLNMSSKWKPSLIIKSSSTLRMWI